MIIDFSSHIIPPDVGKILMKKSYYGPLDQDGSKWQFPYPPENSDPHYRLKVMERFKIDMQVLSPTSPILLGFEKEPKEAIRICKLSNDYIAKLTNKYPEKFVGCALIPLFDVESALDEVDRAIRELGFRCVTIATNQYGKGIDSAEYHPFYEKIAKYDVPVFLHPTHWESYPLVDMEYGWKCLQIFGWPFDTTQAVWRLICSGTLKKFPTLKIVTHHLGGMFPYFVRRVTIGVVAQNLQKILGESVESYFKQIYGDTALNGDSVASLMCGYAFFGPERMLFGSDYPFGPPEEFIGENIRGIEAMLIPQSEKENILGRNAEKLLKL
ncbi:MAG: amidohydrolase [Thaumarchaeota archaeon]|nr:amidohydrolase [Nitrososphaerota archaeon]